MVGKHLCFSGRQDIRGYKRIQGQKKQTGHEGVTQDMRKAGQVGGSTGCMQEMLGVCIYALGSTGCMQEMLGVCIYALGRTGCMQCRV